MDNISVALKDARMAAWMVVELVDKMAVLMASKGAGVKVVKMASTWGKMMVGLLVDPVAALMVCYLIVKWDTLTVGAMVELMAVMTETLEVATMVEKLDAKKVDLMGS